jgi:hypothetical protein
VQVVWLYDGVKESDDEIKKVMRRLQVGWEIKHDKREEMKQALMAWT